MRLPPPIAALTAAVALLSGVSARAGGGAPDAGLALAPSAPEALEADHASELADLAVEASPDLAAAGTAVAALEQQVRAAGAWMDPVVSVSYANMPVDRWYPGGTPMSGIQLQLRQTFYWPGKVAAREAEAEGMVREQQQTLAERRVQLRAMVRRAYYQLALVRQLRDVTTRHLDLVDQLLSVVRVRLEAGRVGQHELLRLQVLRDKLADDLLAFQRDDTSLTAAVNAALHRAVSVRIDTPRQVTPPVPGVDVDQLTAEAVANRPLLKRYLEQVETRRAAARRAAREGYPDPSVSIGYTFRTPAGTDPGTDFISLGLSVPVPLFYDRRSGSLARQNELKATELEQQREAELDRIRGDLGRVVATWKRSAQEARTYRDELIPVAHRSLDATFAAYSVDRADFASLYQAEVQLLDFERVVRQAEVAAALARVDAQALVGRDLP